MNGWKKNGGFTSHLSVYFREIGGRNLRPPKKINKAYVTPLSVLQSKV